MANPKSLLGALVQTAQCQHARRVEALEAAHQHGTEAEARAVRRVMRCGRRTLRKLEALARRQPRAV